METASSNIVAEPAPGFVVRYVPEIDRCTGDPGPARALAAFLNHVVDLPLEEAVRWVDGEDATGGGVTITRLSLDGRAITFQAERVETTAGQIVAALRAVLVRRLADEPYWLFRRTPIAIIPSEGDRSFMTDLDRRSHALFDAMAAGDLDEPAASARRRVLLAELEEAGVLDEARLIDKIYWLRTWGLGAMVPLAEAARDLWGYLRSEVRRVQVGASEPPPARLLEARISLDWMRAPPPVPRGWDAFSWLALGERLLIRHAPPPAVASGRILVVQGTVRAELLWRREDGERAVLHGALLAGGGQLPSR